MNNSYASEQPDDDAIAKLNGRPKADSNGNISRRDIIAMRGLGRLLGEKLNVAADLAEQYAKAEVLQKRNEALKTAESAAEIAASAEEKKADASIKKTSATAGLVEVLKSLEHLGRLEQAIALAKILADNPAISRKLEAALEIVDRLRVTRGFEIQIVTDLTAPVHAETSRAAIEE